MRADALGRMSHSSVGNVHQETAVNAGKQGTCSIRFGNMPHSDFGNMRRSSQWPRLIRGAEAGSTTSRGIPSRLPAARTPVCTGLELSVPREISSAFEVSGVGLIDRRRRVSSARSSPSTQQTNRGVAPPRGSHPSSNEGLHAIVGGEASRN
jgi:hypothetical protein